MKKTSNVHVKLSDAERASIEAAARAENLTLSEYLRRRAVVRSEVTPSAPRAVEQALASYHVDDLGPDTLRADNGALLR